jgi:hypothetical protein
MHVLRVFTTFGRSIATAAPASALLLAACSGNLPSAEATQFADAATTAPAGVAKGVYVIGRESSTVYGYRANNAKNKAPVCSFSSGNQGEISTYDIGADPHGNLIVPTQGGAIVFSGSSLCSSKLGTISDPNETPVDVYSADAANGTVYLATLSGPYYEPNVAVCTLPSGCSKDLSNPYFANGTGVVADASGNIYFTGTTSDHAALLEFAAGTGSGTFLNFVNSSPGGLDIDKHGNVVAFDPRASAVYVYSGCPSDCTAHGPFGLQGESIYGKLNRKGTELVAADGGNNEVDVYAYHGTKGVTYKYSYNNGIPTELTGIATTPGE